MARGDPGTNSRLVVDSHNLKTATNNTCSQPKLMPPKRNHPPRFPLIPAQGLHQQIRTPLLRQRIDDALDAVARTHQHICRPVRERSPDGAVREEV
jgi:hypothetical protein